MAEEERPVGYGNPPLHSRFKPGQSGNPTGRRKARPTLSQQLDRILAEKVQVTEGGTAKRIHKEEIFLRQMISRAISGDRQYGKLLLEYLTKRQANAPEEKASQTDEFLIGQLVGMLGQESGE